ncbi:MAG: hypothetical protein K9I68_10270 [Bacteroidales bacterium]|nr:hypothetical protein [Bacteroidales bacterium]MCF8337358.1 hypothetical protein [Bacteroidales bacterium]
MQTIIVKLTTEDSLEALKELEKKRLIKILTNPDLNSYALPGNQINDEDFKKWIEYTEESPAVSESEAKKLWAKQKKHLQKLTR